MLIGAYGYGNVGSTAVTMAMCWAWIYDYGFMGDVGAWVLRLLIVCVAFLCE